MNVNSPCVRVVHCSLLLGISLLLTAVAAQAEGNAPFLPHEIISSTLPENGDVNPYGVAFVPKGFPAGGMISSGDVLVSNFNNSANLQGTGSTIVKFTPGGDPMPPGTAATFFQSTRVGLSTAMGVLARGLVLVGNVPTTDGTITTISNGSLQVVDRWGHWIQTLANPMFLDSPWDLTIDDDGSTAQVFVSNVLSGTVTRLDIAVQSKGISVLKMTRLATGYMHMPNDAALVLGPTGLALDKTTDTLYVASTADNAIYSITHASSATKAVNKGMLVFADMHLRGPLALRLAPNGHLLTANGDAINADINHPSEIVEFTKHGRFVREFNVDASQGGAFGIDTTNSEGDQFNFAAIDDVTNSLIVVGIPDRN